MFENSMHGCQQALALLGRMPMAMISSNSILRARRARQSDEPASIQRYVKGIASLRDAIMSLPVPDYPKVMAVLNNLIREVYGQLECNFEAVIAWDQSDSRSESIKFVAESTEFTLKTAAKVLAQCGK